MKLSYHAWGLPSLRWWPSKQAIVPAGVQVLLADECMVVQASALGLGLMTYGLENDSGAALERQRQLGVQGAIVDDVQALMAN